MSTTTRKSPSTLSKIIDSLPEIILIVLVLFVTWKMVGAISDEAWTKATFYAVVLLGITVERKLVAIIDTLKSIDSKTFSAYRRY